MKKIHLALISCFIAILSGVAILSTTHDAEAAMATAGSLIKFKTDSRVYLAIDDEGTIEWIPSEAEFKRRGYSFSNIKTLSDAQFNSYRVLAPMIGATPKQITTPIVYVKSGDEVIVNKNGDEYWPAASLTKLMTAMVLEDLNIDWNKGVVMAKGDEVGGARLRVAVGSTYRRIDLLHASLMGSANNSTYTLARTSGITMDQFVGRMNAKARALGMINTRFVDPTGIEVGNISTAADLAKLIEAAETYPRIASIGKKTAYELRSLDKRPVSHSIKSTNKLLGTAVQASLGKTGYLEESMYNFAVNVTDDTGKKRTIVILNAPNQQAVFTLTKQYLNY